jgi:hypothetical protein
LFNKLAIEQLCFCDKGDPFAGKFYFERLKSTKVKGRFAPEQPKSKIELPVRQSLFALADS